MRASEKPADARRPAPEDAKAGAVAKAKLLEGSARALREAGLPEQAQVLEKEAAEQRRRAEAAGPPPGKRLDLMEAYVRRSEGRLQKAKEKEEEAAKALADATDARVALQAELAEGCAKLQALRSELAAQGADNMEDVGPSTAPEEAEGIAALRAQLADALRERDEARAMAPTQAAHLDVAPTQLEESEIQQQLKAAHEAYQNALQADHGDEAQSRVRVLAELTGQLLEAKRRRKA